MDRDTVVNERLTAEGWRVVRIWESDVLRDVEACATRVVEIVQAVMASYGQKS